MYKLIIRKFNGETEKIEGVNLLGFVFTAEWYSSKPEVKSVTVVDRTGFVYLHDSKMQGAKNVAFRMAEV